MALFNLLPFLPLQVGHSISCDTESRKRKGRQEVGKACSLHWAPSSLYSAFGGMMALMTLTGCGNNGVNYSSPTTDAPTIIKDAGKGYLNVTLPVTRLVAQYVPAEANNVAAAIVPGPKAAPLGGKKATPEASTASAVGKSSSAASDLTTTIILDDGGKVTLTVVQVEGPTKFRVSPINDFWSSNKFSVQRMANTEIATSVGNTFTDMTVSRIQSAITIATTVAKAAALALPLAPGDGKAIPRAPNCAKPNTAILDLDGTSSIPAPLRLGCYTLTINAPPAPADDTVAVSYFTSALTTGANGHTWSNKVWPVPACMDLSFSVASTAKVEYEGVLRVIDPKNVEVLPVPQSGKIALHPICGADFSDSPTDKYQSYFDTMNAILKAIPNATPAAGKQTAGKK